MIRRTLVLAMVCGSLVGPSFFASTRAEEPVSFARDIKPIFDSNCSACHSAAARVAQLDLSSRESALKGGDHGPAIVPGKADDSRLYRLVSGLELPGMPLDGNPLSPEQVATIRIWINEGAHWEGAAPEAGT